MFHVQSSIELLYAINNFHFHFRVGDKDGDDKRLEPPLAVCHYDSGFHRAADTHASDAAVTSGNSRPPSGSPSSPVVPPATTDFAAVSLDDAWKTLTGSGKQRNGKNLRLHTPWLTPHFLTDA